MIKERLMKTPEEVKQKARELLQMPKEEVLTKYMFQEQEIERLNKALQDIKEYIETRAGTEIHDMMYVMETDEILDIVNKAIGK